jgi:NAD(P)-dependent dehydrogenase (short-subunit alcohol dehydrogenase family)
VELRGAVALVTGAGRRVGRRIALRLAEHGADVAVHYRSSRRDAEALARELRALGVDAEALRADLARPADCERLARTAVRRFGRVDVLVNSASIYAPSRFGKTRPAEWDAYQAVNLRAPFLLAQALGPRMKRLGGGKIVNIADGSGLRPNAGFMPYCVSKAGLLALNAALAKALAPEVQVNAVLPGPVLMPAGSRPRRREKVLAATLLKRMGDPDDVARAVLYLLEADFVTGTALPVDGGRLAA